MACRGTQPPAAKAPTASNVEPLPIETPSTSRAEVRPTEIPAPAKTPPPSATTTEKPVEIAPEEVDCADPAACAEMTLSASSCEYGGKIKEITALNPLTVRFTMCKPDLAFPAKAAFAAFGIQPKEYIEATGGTGDLLEKPVGTGPYMLESWNRGDSIIFKRFDNYWGNPAIAETMVLRWAPEGEIRLLELQFGTVDQIVGVRPDDYDTVRNDPNLQLLPEATPNVLYLAMPNTSEPFHDARVRKAIALGIDRRRIVDNFYPAGSEVASHFTPCSIPNGCTGEVWYGFDLEAARALLAEAGYSDGFQTKIFYRDEALAYLPSPGPVVAEIQTQLKENLGINTEIVALTPDEFITQASAGNLDGFYLLGKNADYPHITNFLDFHFGQTNRQFGTPYPEIYETLAKASQISDPASAGPLYAEANNAIRKLVPMVPIAHGAAAQAARADIDGAHARPFGPILGHIVEPHKDTFVFMQNAEPASLYCGDETDRASFNACGQVVESLLAYDVDSGAIIPALAVSCDSNEKATVWTCHLREGVKFHDGSDLDAGDVLMSWAMGLDAANPYHVGNTGAFKHFLYLWGGLMNVE